MDPKLFTANATGRLVPIGGQRSDVTHAFIPDPLPPKWTWPPRLWPLLVEARAAVASLDGTGKHLPNPELLLRPIQQREAQLSSKLEGTITDPQYQVLFQAQPKEARSEHDPSNAMREVSNYANALRLRLDGEYDLPLSERLMRDLHAVLMTGVRGAEQQPGEFRRIQNQIGRPARFVPPPPDVMLSCLHNLEEYLHTPDDELDPLVRAFVAHYQFESIHPFCDGNGRVGRLLLSLSIAEWCKLSSQWLYMSAFFERNKKDYMDLMLSVSTDGHWEHWIEFCLQGVIEQAKDTERRCEKLLLLHRDFHNRLVGAKGSVRLAALIDRLFGAPVVTVTTVVDWAGVTYPTAKSDLQRLANLDVLTPLTTATVNAYYCPAIMDIIFEDVLPLT